jgi:hypothetical protein
MVPARFDWTQQIQKVVLKYPNLLIINHQEGKFVKGILDITDDNGSIAGSYSIEIKRSNSYPYRFPIVYEVGGDIPNLGDFHKYGDGSCCITVLPDELLICKNGIEVAYFIDKHVIPYFANQIHKKLTGNYKNEYAHNIKGLHQFYLGLFKTSDQNQWPEILRLGLQEKHIKIGRNDPCFCGSGVKFKHCHDQVFLKIRSIGKDQINEDFKKMMI